MRRSTRANESSIRHQRRMGHSAGDRGGGGSRSTSHTVVKIALGCVVLWGLYLGFLKGGRPADHQPAVVDVNSGALDSPSDGFGTGEAVEGGRGTKRKGMPFRQLNMLGYENSNADSGGWKTCRAYTEQGLAPHKKNGERGFDREIQSVKPKPDAEWELAISEDTEAEWLGLHQWDDRYEYGSEEADRRVAETGYCRIHMPSVPRTGSTWFRAMFETATSQATFSMWPEGGTKKQKYMAFSSDDPCGASLDHMEGMLTSKRVFPCRDLKPPNATSPILFKSHTPFYPSYNKPSLMPEQTCMLVLLVRNPIDNHDAWQRYMQDKAPILRDYLPLWEGHINHWIAAAGDIPIYVFRYEDMLDNPADVLRRVLQALPGGWKWSAETIAKAMRLFGPKKKFSDKCGAGFKVSSLAEVEMVRRHYGDVMRHFGYRFIKK